MCEDLENPQSTVPVPSPIHNPFLFQTLEEFDVEMETPDEMH